MIPLVENNSTEFKTTFNDEVIISLVAFSNAIGGSVYIGVTDKAEIKGVETGKETVQNWVMRLRIKPRRRLFLMWTISALKEKLLLSFR